MTDAWVVNTSPLIALAKVGHLDLLQDDNRVLWIPPAVRPSFPRSPWECSPRRSCAKSSVHQSGLEVLELPDGRKRHRFQESVPK